MLFYFNLFRSLDDTSREGDFELVFCINQVTVSKKLELQLYLTTCDRKV